MPGGSAGAGAGSGAGTSRAGHREEWADWQTVFDRVDAEEGILAALEVRRRLASLGVAMSWILDACP